MPVWVNALICAEAWGVPPWTLARLRGRKKLWIHRQLAWRDAQIERANREMQHE